MFKFSHKEKQQEKNKQKKNIVRVPLIQSKAEIALFKKHVSPL